MSQMLREMRPPALKGGGGVGVDVSVRTCDFEHVIVWARHDGCLGCSEC